MPLSEEVQKKIENVLVKITRNTELSKSLIESVVLWKYDMTYDVGHVYLRGYSFDDSAEEEVPGIFVFHSETVENNITKLTILDFQER